MTAGQPKGCHFEFVNCYGPTECTVFCTSYTVPNEATNPPIGRTLASAKCYILDSSMRPVPVGVSGELCIAGPQVARGYMKLDEKTKEVFVPNPFDESGKERMYRTGDVVKFLPDGNIAYVGRRDFQVKISGYRIELG